MIWLPFKIRRLPKKFLGIDIGTSSVRVVELSKKGQALKLENYGEIKTFSLTEAPFRAREKDTLFLSDQEIAKAILAILKEAGIKTREVNFSIPDFSTFFTSFTLPPMSQEELSQAIKYEARAYIPLPLSEVTLDWLVIEGELLDKTKTPLKVLVAAIPNEVISQYQKIAWLSNLELRVLEPEVFALSRASVKNNEKKLLGLIDIGARSTTVNILENKILKISHSFNISGNELTQTLSRSLNIDYEGAEELKKNYGLIKTKIDSEELKKNYGLTKIDREIEIREILLPLVDSILAEIKKIFQGFYQQEGKEIEKIILAGESALMPGLKEYFFEELRKEVEIVNPFSDLISPAILVETLKEMGPSYAIAVGLAMKGLE